MAHCLYQDSKSLSAIYSKFRPPYPQSLVERIIEYMKEKKDTTYSCAVDVGCGSGQFTKLLVNDFEQVIGVDISSSQVSQANETAALHQNIEYRMGSEGDIPVPNGSVDLVTSAQAAQWFNMKHFYDEVDRVLKPCGSVAVLGYAIPVITSTKYTQKLQQAVLEFYSGYLKDFVFKEGPELYIDKCTAPRFRIPYQDSLRDDSMVIQYQTTVAGYLGYISSWSAYQNYIQHNPSDENALNELQDSLLEIMGVTSCAEETKVEVTASLFCLLGTKPGLL